MFALARADISLQVTKAVTKLGFDIAIIVASAFSEREALTIAVKLRRRTGKFS